MQNTERLNKLLGFDPTKRQSVTQELFKEVMDQVNADRMEKAREQAREQITKAIELRQQAAQLEKEFTGKMQKFDKELGKILSSLERSLNPNAPQAAEEEEEEKEA